MSSPPFHHRHTGLSQYISHGRTQAMTQPCENHPAEYLLCLVIALSPAPGSGLIPDLFDRWGNEARRLLSLLRGLAQNPALLQARL